MRGSSIRPYRLNLILAGIILCVSLLCFPDSLPAEVSDRSAGKEEGLSPADQIELYLKGKVNFMDNYSSELLLLLADRLFEQEFGEVKNMVYSARSREGGNYLVSFRKTIEFLDEIIKKRGNDRFLDRFLYLRGYCYLEQGNHDRAFEDFTRVVEGFPLSNLYPEASFRLAEYYFSTEQLALAIEAYEKTLKEKGSPYYDKALYKLGWAYYLTSNFPEAIAYFIKLAELSYSFKKDGSYLASGSEDLSFEGLVYAAISYTNTGDADEVLKKVGKNLKPYSKILLSEVAQAYFDQSRYVDFIKVYKVFVARFKKVPPLLEMENEIIAIRELDRSNKEEALKRKELFVERYYLYVTLAEMVRYREKLDIHLRPMIRELASFFHKQGAETGRKELFKKAGGYYSKYLVLYGKAKDIRVMNLYYADALYEYGDYHAAVSRFETAVSSDSGDLSLNEKALYGAVLSWEKLLKGVQDGADAEKRASTEQKLVDAEKKYTYIFPESKKSGPLYFRQGKRLFDKRSFDEAIPFFEKAGTLLSDELEKNSALEYLADSCFNSRWFYRALSEYSKLLRRSRKTGDDDGVRKAEEYISRSNVNIAEKLLGQGKIRQGARRYELASDAFVKSEDKERVLGKAMRLYISVRMWQDFDRVYRRYRALYPDRERLGKIVLQAANVARENFDFINSGKYFERLASLGGSPEKTLRILVTAAREYERGDELQSAIRIFSELYKARAVSGAQQLEFRYKAAELLERDERTEESERLYRDVVALHLEYTGRSGREGTGNGGGNRYFFGKASLKLLRKPYEDFISTALLPPFSVNFPKRLAQLGELVKRFMAVAKLDITEFSTRSLYSIGYLFESFRKSIIESPSPAGLGDEEREEYSFMLEEKAFPYEERSVMAYEKSISIGRKKGVSDGYIDLCYERLSEISPAVYKRDEDIFLSKVVPLPPAFGFIGTIDLETLNREKDRFYFERERN